MTVEAYPDALPAGYRLHWYVLEHVLGQGGFGITYLARDTNLDRRVAIKEYLPSEIARRRSDAAAHPSTEGHAERFTWGLERFLAEARTLARFAHPNIVHVHSIFEANNTAYMVMRYEDGESLHSLLERTGTLSETQLLNCLLPILDGLQMVHAAGFVHRDIKPANIYVRHDGSPVLLDFGSARQAFGSAKTMTILVAPGYAPLEQYYGDAATQGAWTDIYSLGATCYRAIAGRAPLDAVARAKGVLGSAREVLEPALEVGRGRYGAALLAAVDHALQLTEQDRPQDIASWRRELVAAASLTPSVPSHQSLAASATVPVAAPLTAPTAAPVTAAPAGPVSSSAAVTAPALPPPAPPPAPPPRSLARWLWPAAAAAAAAGLATWVVTSLAPAPPHATLIAAAPPPTPAAATPLPPAPVLSTRAAVAVAPPPAAHELPRPSASSLAPAEATRQPVPRPAPSPSRSPSTNSGTAGPVPTQAPVALPRAAQPTAAAPAPAPMAAPMAAPVSAPAATSLPAPTLVASTSPAPPTRDAELRAQRLEQIEAADAALRRGDHAAAAQLLAPLAAAGLPRAQALLGRVQESRPGKQHSDFEAYVWYSIAARNGDAIAVTLRDKVAQRLQAAEIRQAENTVQRWRPRSDTSNAAGP